MVSPYTLDIVREWVPALNLSGISVAPSPTTSGMALPEDKFRDLMTIEGRRNAPDRQGFFES